MKHNAKRVLSIVLCALMCVSMLTAIVLPAAAEEVTPADPYAKITGSTDGNVITPDANVYFVDPAWATSAPAPAKGETFEYTYGDGTWGNGKTYLLTWGTNTGTSIEDIKAISKEYNTDWAGSDELSDDLVIVCAPGEYGYVKYENANDLAAKAGEAKPSSEELMNFILLGPQAGKSAVSAKKDNKADAKAIQNNRSSSVATEAALTNTFWIPGYCNFYVDGFAVTKAARLYQNYSYNNIYFDNLYFADQTTPAVNSIMGIGGGSRPTTLEIRDCYFNMNISMTNATLTSEDNTLIANKLIIDNCVFAEGKLSASASKANWQTHHIKLYPNTAACGTDAAAFFGEYATKPLIQISNCVAADWESAHLFRPMLDNANWSGYNGNAIQLNIQNNKFYDVGTCSSSSDVFFFNKVTTEDQANSFTLNMTDNLISFSDEVFDQGTTGSSYFFTMNGAANVAGYKLNIRENIFKVPNNKMVSIAAGHDNAGQVIDFSGNLFLDNDNNILPLYIQAGSPPGYSNGNNVVGDIYASAAMKGGVRELMTITEVENGVVAYCFIQTRRRGNLSDLTYFTGGLTLLLKNGVTYNTNSMFKTLDPDVKVVGVYTEETCKNKVDTLTQDTINGKFLKLEYKEAGTTATVVYTLNTPQNYLIVDPTSAYKTNGYTFNGKVYKDGQKTDGVLAKFYTNISTATTASTGPNMNDLLALTTAQWTDKDGTKKAYTNNLSDLVILVPGNHTFAGKAGGNFGSRKNFCIVGPQWGVSPYGDANKEGKLANGRSVDTTKEAVLDMMFTPAADQGGVWSVVLDGIAFKGTTSPINMAHNTNSISSPLQFNVFKNIVFANSAATLIGGQHAANNGKILHMTVKDCVYDCTGLDRSKVNAPPLNLRANFCTIENFAILNDSTPTDRNRLAYVYLTDGTKMTWEAKRIYCDFNNITIYNSNRDGLLYTLRESAGACLNATKEYYPNGAELNITGWNVIGGQGYFYGVQGNETQDDFVTATVKNNYFYRPDYTGNVISHYQDTNPQLDVYTDDSVFEDNTIVVNDTVKMNAYVGDLNVDDNFYGKLVDGKVVATYITTAKGVEKDFTTYYMDVAKTVKNTDIGLADNGYKSIEIGAFEGYNQYAIDATNMTATPAIFKAAAGATIVGVYTDAECTTEATAFTHPQDVYVKVTKGEYTLVNKVELTCVCSHDGSTYESVIDEPTCTVDGKKGNFCEYCDSQIGNDITIPATGEHTLGELIVDTAPNCTVAGVGHKDCTVCLGTIESGISIPVVSDAHIWNTEYTVDLEPTCTTEGNKSIHCSLCDEKQIDSDLPIKTLPHDWEEEYTVDKEPTCQADGAKSIHCSVCDNSKENSTIVIPMGAHVWEENYTVDVPSTCLVAGVESIHCSICSTRKQGSIRELPLADHEWEENYIVDKEPTCTKAGSKSVHCYYCNEINAESITEIPVLDHNWGGFEIVTAPTCTKDGAEARFCVDCGAKGETNAIAAGHAEAEVVYIVIPTYQEGGIAGEICPACGEVLDQWAVDAIAGANAADVFDDVDENDWYYENDAVNFVYNNGLMNGVTKNEFAADAELTRGMFVTILGRIAGVDAKGDGKTAFKDVDAKAWYAPFVKWAAEEGIVSGYSATAFGPNDSITREQICKMILEFCNTVGVTTEQVNKAVAFKDAAEISTWAKKYVKACQMAGLINGEKSGNGYIFRPKDTASRAEAATIIRNFCYGYLIN